MATLAGTGTVGTGRTSGTIAAAARVEALRAILPPFVLTRLLFLALTFAASWWSGFAHLPQAALTLHENPLSDRWYRWDAIWYMRVATDGYRTVAYANHHLNLAFFPLFPLLLHTWLAFWPFSRVAAALLLANLCHLAASYLLFMLVRLDYGPAHARRVVWLLALFPTSLFLFAGYSESLFLLCLVGCCYAVRAHRWWPAALWGGLAAATRPLGVILVGPLLIGWYQAQPGAWSFAALAALLRERAGRVPHRAFGFAARLLRRRAPAEAASMPQVGLRKDPAPASHDTALVPLRAPRESAPHHERLGRAALLRAPLALAATVSGGLLAYAGYLWARFGNPLAFSASQRSWHRTWAWPWQTFGAALSRPFLHLSHPSADELHAALDTTWGVVFLALTLYAVRRLPPIYVAFLCLFWAMVLATPALLDGVPDPLISLPRFLLTAFPLLIVLGATPRRALVAGALSLPLLVLNTAIFVSGGWVA